MSFKSVLLMSLALVLVASALSFAGDSEQDIVNKYLAKSEKAQIQKLGWLSVNYQFNRVNRRNDYNSMASALSSQIPGADFQWIGEISTFGMEFGTALNKKWFMTIGAEYWAKTGNSFTGTYTYTPASGISVQVVDPKSEVSVWGITTGAQYYLKNAPQVGEGLSKLAIRTGLSAGYYAANWELFNQYQNLNLATASPEAADLTYQGHTIGFSFNVGAEYPIRFWDLNLAMDVNYLHLNFGNVAAYNTSDQEIVATYDGQEDGRVDLGMSGFRGKFELKRYFSW